MGRTMKKLDPRSVLIGFLVAVIGFMSMGAKNTTFDSITVGNIVMKEESLFLWNAEKKPVIAFMASAHTNVTAFYNTKEQPMIYLAENESGNGIIQLDNNAGKTTVLLANDLNGRGVIAVNGASGHNTVTIGHTEIDGGGAISVKNANGQATVSLMNDSKGNGDIRLSNNLGHETISIDHVGEDAGAIKIYNKHGKQVVYMSSTLEDDGNMILSDRYGEGQWSLTGKRK